MKEAVGTVGLALAWVLPFALVVFAFYRLVQLRRRSPPTAVAAAAAMPAAAATATPAAAAQSSDAEWWTSPLASAGERDVIDRATEIVKAEGLEPFPPHHDLEMLRLIRAGSNKPASLAKHYAKNLRWRRDNVQWPAGEPRRIWPAPVDHAYGGWTLEVRAASLERSCVVARPFRATLRTRLLSRALHARVTGDADGSDASGPQRRPCTWRTRRQD
jgi:hypothetical protein